jgi:hypothetical protein
MRFFVPTTSVSESEPAYLEMKRSLVDQLRFPIQERRIFRLNYTNSKRNWQIEVGKGKPQESQYIAVAIFEASVFIVLNQTTTGGPGPIVLIDKSEVTEIEDFQA